MTAALYATLDESETRFDGHRAQTHLTRRLAMSQIRPDNGPELARKFDRWLADYEDHIAVHPKGPIFLIPPGWYR